VSCRVKTVDSGDNISVKSLHLVVSIILHLNVETVKGFCICMDSNLGTRKVTSSSFTSDVVIEERRLLFVALCVGHFGFGKI
jgi:hypothetical protein